MKLIVIDENDDARVLTGPELSGLLEKTTTAALQEAVFTFAHDVGTPLMIAGNLTELMNEDAHLTSAQRADVARMLQAYRDISQKVIALREFASKIRKAG